MRTIEIESWALRVIAGIQAGTSFEDSRIELKTELPEPGRAARRIAAHANSAFSEPILWLIGVDQEKGLTGAKVEDLAGWLPSMVAAFDGVYPSVQDVVVSVKGVHVLCLLFETSRAPFLVKTPAGGAIQREVPWREGTMTRTATREEILRMVQPDVPLPKIEILAGSLHVEAGENDNGKLKGTLKIYLVPKSETMLVIPFHRCSARLLDGTKVVCEKLEIGMRKLRPFSTESRMMWIHRIAPTQQPQPQSVTVKREADPVEIEDYQAVFYRPAMVNLTVSGSVTKDVWNAVKEPILEVSIRVASDESRAVVLAARLPAFNPGVFKFGELSP
jgi:hypothetical protein